MRKSIEMGKGVSKGQLLMRRNEIFQKMVIDNSEIRERLPNLADSKKLDIWGAFKNMTGNKESGGALPGNFPISSR